MMFIITSLILSPAKLVKTVMYEKQLSGLIQAEQIFHNVTQAKTKENHLIT